MVIGVLMKYKYIDHIYNTNDSFLILKILTLEQLYNRSPISKVFMNKSELNSLIQWWTL